MSLPGWNSVKNKAVSSLLFLRKTFILNKTPLYLSDLWLSRWMSLEWFMVKQAIKLGKQTKKLATSSESLASR